MDPTFLCPPSHFKYTNMEILLILLDIDRRTANPVVSPSKYLSEMSMNTQERLEKLNSTNRKEKIRPDIALRMLKALPDIVVFQNYSTGDKLTVTVNILNTYEVSRSMYVILPPTTVFAVTHPSGVVTTKIAPGMSYQFIVHFHAQDRLDYRHFITVVSDEEVFAIPIICISDRPLLDIPDKITLPAIPVKTVSERSIIVRNLGEMTAIFTTNCSPGFSVSPARGCVNSHRYIMLTIQFVSDLVEERHGRMMISYASGETLTVALEASTYETDIFLEPSVLEAQDTFLSLKRKAVVKLVNRSKHIARYSWMLYKDKETSESEMLKYKKGFLRVKELESQKFAHMVHGGVIAGGDTHDAIYERIYQDELREFEEKDALVYTNKNWSITPLEGEIWPDNFTKFFVTFTPTEAAHYESTMYLEVSGREKRIPLKLSGVGKGPHIILNLEELNAGDIFLCSKHQYEVCVFNKGHIPGVIMFNPKPFTFGGILSCEPLSNYMQPFSYASFVVEFFSNVQGNFVEEIEFVIQESNETRKIVFKGNIVCPLLNFEEAEVNFGKVTFGYPVTTYINLINTTQVPIEYVTKFSADGEIPAMSCIDYANQQAKPTIFSPKELNFQPNSCVVLPNSAMKGELILLPNVQGKFVKRLIIIMWDTPKYSISLPIHYVCEIPDVVCDTQDIFMRGCFVNYVYTRSITIRNNNGHAGYFVFVPYDVEGPTDIVFEPKVPEDYIDAYETKEMELDIFTKFIGHATLKLHISIFGGSKMLYLCTIRCNGQGPVITVPEHLYFEEIRTLKTASQFIKIVNDSPVPARVKVTQSKKSWLTITQNLLSLNPSENLNLEVRAYMRTPGNFSDRVIFTTEEGETQVCSIKATAVGSSILCEPDLEPEINLGILLTHLPFSLNVKFTNMCKKHHKIIWSRAKKLKSFRDDAALYTSSVFSLKPNAFDLAPGQSIDCVLSACGSKVGTLEEDFYCHACIDNKRDYGVVTSFLVVAEFVCPMLELSHSELKFRIDFGIDQTIAFLEDTVTVKNISKLGITANIGIEYPFYINLDGSRVNSLERYLEDEETLVFKVEFVPKSKNKNCVVWTEELAFSYVEHPYKHKIPVRAEENFPNLKIEPEQVNFNCLPNFFTGSIQLIVKNISPLPVSFLWEWISDELRLEKLDVVPIKWPTASSEETTSFSTISTPILGTTTNIEDVPTTTELNSQGQLLGKRVELDAAPPAMMTAKVTEAQAPEEATVRQVELVPRYLNELRVMLYQLVDCYDADQAEVEALRCLPEPSEDQVQCDEIFDLIPTYGYLGPYEAQMVSLEFSPWPNTTVEATVHCHLNGGKTEILNVTGKSSNLSFSVENDVIEFGRQLFCEICEQKILIKNTGFAPLQIEAIYHEPPEVLQGAVPSSNWYNVALTRVNSDYEVSVKFFPGLTREFTQKFALQIAYLEPYYLTIHGFGVLSQIFCAIPRTSLDDELVNYLSYSAIASLTPEFTKDVRLLTQVDLKFKADMPYNVREVLKENEWVILSYNEEFPSVADIQMAVERTIVDLYVSKNYDILFEHTIEKTSSIISNKLIAPPYVIDFKYVIKDTQVFYTVSILNYGPVATHVHSTWMRKAAHKYGLRSKFSRSNIEVGMSVELYVSFSPSAKVFRESDCAISETLYIMVPHGLKVPIEVRAFVTLPQVTPSSKRINFDQVHLGSCLKKDVIIRNTGFVPCKWEIRIEVDNRNPYKQVFFSKTSEGTLDVGEQMLLDIYFEPAVKGKAKALMVITIDENPQEIEVCLKGYGEKPRLMMSETTLHFPSTLPYTEHVEMMFTIANTSMYPIEFIFSDFDTGVETEEQIINLLLDYYKKNRLFIPQRKPGDGLSCHIVNFYNNILKSIRARLGNEIRLSEPGSTADLEAKTAPTPSSVSSVTGKRLTSQSYDKDLLSSKTPEELQCLLKDQIRLMREEFLSINTNENMPDPIGDAIDDAIKRPSFSSCDEKVSGILLIFHGAPQTDYVQAANRAGLILKLPVVSVDKLMFDALVKPLSLAAIKVRQILDDSFFEVASEIDLANPPDYDEYDELQKKIDLLLSGKKKKKKPSKKTSAKEPKKGKKGKKDNKTSNTSKKSSKSDSSKPSKDKKAKKDKKGKKGRKTESSMKTSSSKSIVKTKVDKRPTLMGISEDLLFEILEIQLLSYKSGLIVESLNSTFIKRPTMLLNWLLKVIGNIRYIHCVLLSYTYKDHLLQKESNKIIDVGNKLEERKNKIQEIMHMGAESYANLSTEDMQIFKEDVLIPRKLDTEKKKEELRRRLLNKKKSRHQRKKNRRKHSKTEDQSKRGPKAESSSKIPVGKDKKKTKKTKSSSKSSKSKKNSAKSKKSAGKKSKSKSSKSKSSKGSKKGTQKERLSAEELETKKLLVNSEDTIWEILHILEHWDRKHGILTKPIPTHPASQPSTKKPKSSKSSASSKKSTEKKTSPIPTSTPDEFVLKIFSPQEMEKFAFIGVPCWVIENASKARGTTVMESLCYYLSHTPELLDAQIEIQTSLMPKLQEADMLFSVIQRQRRRREKCRTEAFGLWDVDVLSQKDWRRSSFMSDNESPRRGSLRSRKTAKRSRSRLSSTSLDRSTISTRTSTRSNIKSREGATESTRNLTTRAVIQSGGRYTYKATFTPKTVGDYVHAFGVELVGCPTKYSIKCHGKCEIPGFNMDPSVMFGKVAETRLKANRFDKCVYFLDDGLFDFGITLLPHLKTTRRGFLERSAKLTFSNELFQTCETQLVLIEDRYSTNVFSVTPERFSAVPDERKEIEISSFPKQLGNFSADLIVLIKNNPQVYAIHLCSSAIDVSVCFDPESVDFERSTINHNVNRTVRLRNLSPVKIKWKAVEIEDLLLHFRVYPQSGVIIPHSQEKIEFEFIPGVVENIPRKDFNVIVFDADHETSEPLCRESLGVSAEVIEVDVDCPKELHFGEVKGMMKHTYPFPVLSKIKYNMEVMFTEVDPQGKSSAQKAIAQLFQIRPKHMALKCGKVSNADVIFFSTTHVDFVKMPIFKCTVFDPSTNNVIMTFDVTATATTHFARYKVCPNNEIDFGHQLVGCEKSDTISLHNKGKFEFNYVIVSQTKLQEQKKKKKSKKSTKGKKGKKSPKGKKKSSKSSGSKSKATSEKTKSQKSQKSKSTKSKDTKSTKSSKKKNSKISKKDSKKFTPKFKPTKLDVGCFSIVSSTGVLEPGETAWIKVTSRPKRMGLFRETILFFIPECESKHKKGIPIVVVTKAIVPSFNFSNFREIFCQQYVVNSMSDFNCPEQVNTNLVFVIEECTLYFNKVCINTASETKIRIQNTSVVTTTLSATIKESTIFSIYPNERIVDPFSNVTFTIKFVPSAIQTYYSALKLSFECLIKTTNNELTINICGEGYVPEIAIRQPEIDPVDNSYYLLFRPLLVGQSDTEAVVIENTGAIPCKVIAEICYDATDMLSFTYEEAVSYKIGINHESTTNKMSLTNNLPVLHNIMVQIEPGGSISLSVHFRPTGESSDEALLKLQVVNNPFEVYKINIKTESFMEDIILEGLPIASIQFPRGPTTWTVTSRYELDFGYCTINSLKNIRFVIKNISKFHIYRFDFTNYDKLTFSPSVGHLKPGTCKEVLATFLPTSSISLIKEILSCIVCRIQYVDRDNELLSWDDRQNVVIWKEHSEVSLIGKKSISASLSARKAAKESSKIISKLSTDEMSPPARPSRSIIKPTTGKRSMASIGFSTTDMERRIGSSSVTASLKEKKIESKPEPAYLQLQDSLQCIDLLTSMTADFCTYTCNTREIVLEDTLMFEKRVATFTVTNTSTMPLHLNWIITMNECYPRRINSVNNTPEELDVFKSRSSQALANVVKQRTSKSARQRPAHLTGNELFVSGDCDSSYARPSSSIFSSESSVRTKTRDSWHEADYMPFIIEPSDVTVPSNETKEFKVTFAPIDVFQYLVHVCSPIQNLHPEDAGLEVTVQAKSLLPLYHFDIVPSDYLSRRQSKLCGDAADVSTKVVEFDAIGLNMQHTRSFNVINPTGENFKFRWDQLPSKTNNKDKDVRLFHCNTPEGSVTKGKMAVSSFSFIPDKHGTFEAFYIFTIEKYNLKTTFLLTGTARNPCVFFSSSHVAMKPTLINVEVTESITLNNNEDMELIFAFKKSSLLSSDHSRKVSIEPMMGTLKPKSKIPISLAMKASQTGEVEFKLNCVVERMHKPLILTVLATVYDVEPSISYVTADGNIPLDSKSVNTFELKSLVVREEDKNTFLIRNKGKIGFYYKWQSVEKFCEEYADIDFHDEDGYCQSAAETYSVIAMKPIKQLLQKRFKIILQISHGPKYVIHLICTTPKAAYRFSFEEYDFGQCLVQTDKTNYYQRFLEFTNLDKTPLTLEYETGVDANLSVTFKAKEVPPKASENIAICFHPRDVGDYKFSLGFLVNSKIHTITIKGAAGPLVLQLVNQEDKFLNFGALLVEKEVTRIVQVANKSSASVCVFFDLYYLLPFHTRPKRILEAEYEKETPPAPDKKKSKKGKKDKKGKKTRKSKESKSSSKSSKKSSKKGSKNSKGKQKSGDESSKSGSKSSKRSKSSKSSKKNKKVDPNDKKKKKKKDKQQKAEASQKEQQETAEEREERLIMESVKVSPKKFIKIAPGSATSITITFSPKQKMPTFTKKIFYQVQDQIEPLCLVKGSCIAADYYLDREKIAFGSVVKGCSTDIKFTLFNTGDIGGKYKWKFEKQDSAISIEPMEGYISPDMSITLTAKYQPKQVKCFASAKAKCTIEYYKQPLRLELTGSCTKKPPSLGTVKFSCPVRAQTTSSIPLDNKTSEPWYLEPRVLGAYFTPPETVYVAPQSSTSCEVIFSPTMMTTQEQPHKATLIFELPDGHCMVYNLEGIADKPLPVEKLERNINCKTQYTEALDVENWLKTPQQFKAITRNLKPQESKNVLYKFTGNAVIDVPAGRTRQYKWGIFVLNAGTLRFEVLFKNEITQEYLFYEITLNVTIGGALEEINLSTCVRMPCAYKLKLENPIKTPVVFHVSSTCETLSFEKTAIVEPCSEKIINVDYVPLIPGVADVNLEVLTKELGVFLYHFHLEASSPVPEAPVIFKCPLGQNIKRKISLHNYCSTKAEFRVKLQSKQIFSTCDIYRDTLQVSPGEDAVIELMFEPNSIGNVQSSLTLESVTAGQYIYPLIGTCVYPTPQGPLYVKPGASTTFIFKNPFDEAKTFKFKTNSDMFSVKSTSETLQSRQAVKVTVHMVHVKFDTVNGKPIPFTGKLVVTSPGCNVPQLKWTYYLQADCRK